MSQLSLNADASDILRTVSVFADIREKPEAIKALSSVMKKHSYAAGHLLIEEGSVGHEFFVLVRGSVSIYKKTPDGDRYKVAVVTSQNHPALGEGGLMDGEVRSASVICESPVECLSLSRNDFESFGQAYPQYALPIFKRVAQSLMTRLQQTSTDLMLLHKALMDEIRSS